MSKKKKLAKTLVEKILDKQNISYQSFTPFTKNKIDKERVYKTLVLTGNNTGPLVGVLPLSKHLSYKMLAKISGNKKVAMVPLKNLQATSGFEHGANSPIGIREQHNYPIYFDKQALIDQNIIVSAGKIGHSVEIDAITVAQLVDGQFGSFAINNPE
ncbi:YbaK/EbsC family protein [Bombilactobacillus thymidiniphilus]|uniref:Cys-tRNA(Pro)/Cys-tRNA(Cys) deacylase n=1 Tax=Bombilactobacillus thymidiniphilus TaxID=2923363 RepID=A0ABY4PCN5_9LACO|nr:YbaK/EbsC family protein [Bombilactobacillus thymidiniphilus]UQS83525.1 Cys-tRNA(Pro) deacylase [Bombilactobacillus thymidiniphilus]